MITIFRKIRQLLLSESRLGRYLIYAIGEIFLVVIGILIALQINNWNESKKLKKQELTNYCKISEDLKMDLINIDTSILSVKNRLESANRLLINLMNLQEDKTVLLKDFTASVRDYKFIPTRAAITDITSSGKLENLNNQDLKSRILNHYTQQDNALNIIQFNYSELIEKIFGLESYADFGFQEVPAYKNSYDKQLHKLLKSTEWQKDPTNALFIKFKDALILNIIQSEREISLLNDTRSSTLGLFQLLEPYCEGF
jgi:hypothetical protein